MAKEILFYSYVNASTVSNYINAMNENMDEPSLVLRINSGGGHVDDAVGLIAKTKEYKGDLKIKVDGYADSMAAFFLFYADANNIEATDLSTSVIHRAAYPEWVEASKELMTEDRVNALKRTNENLRSVMESRVDANLWQEVTGKTLDEVFSMESRIDVKLNAKQMKKLGIIGKINTITPKKKAEIDAISIRMAASSEVKVVNEEVEIKTKPEKKKMTKEELKASHPEVYNAIIADERDRVGAWMAFVEIDAKRVQEGIKAGSNLGQTDIAELSLQALSNKEVKAIEAASAPEIETEKIEVDAKSEDEVRLEAFEAEFKTLLKK